MLTTTQKDRAVYRQQESSGEPREAGHKPQGTNGRHEAEVMQPESVLIA
jgi:hypothetical protein